MAAYRATRYVEGMIQHCIVHESISVGVPHRLTQDDLHEGYFIPKGSVVIANIWYVYTFKLCS